MSSKINVLIFPAGEINSVELHDALATCLNINLYGASSIERHGKYIFKNYISGLPLVDSPVFIEKFNDLITSYKIDLIFPTHDTIAKFLSENNHKIKAKIIAADKETSAICRDKKRIYDSFKKFDFVPTIYSHLIEFPVFIKPRIGQGGQGAKLLQSKLDLPFDFDLNNYIISEYLPGEEYTVDCFTDKNGRLLFISPRSRKRLLAGITISGAIEPIDNEIQFIAETINEKLKFLGLWWFQIKKDKSGKWKLLEISTRVAGTMCLTRALGINLPLLSVYTAMGIDVEVFVNNYLVEMDRTLMGKYSVNYEYDTVYFDLDDTLIINGEINLNAIRFLYQCKNMNKKVILITKHEYKIKDTLEKHAIAENLFVEIIHLCKDEHKTDYVNPEKSIFIDNAFKERSEVHKAYGIPVFDVDGIEFLLDWKS